MTYQISIEELAARLPGLIEQIRNGDEVVINEGGQAIARVVPVRHERKPRQPGGAKGLIHISDDFNDPLPEHILKDFGV